MKAIIIRTDGLRELVDFTDETCYRTLSDAVGGLIECVALPSLGVDMWLHEEGRLIGLNPNPQASKLFIDEFPWVDIPAGKEDYAIVGDVIITGGPDDQGNTTGLNDEQVEKFTESKLVK